MSSAAPLKSCYQHFLFTKQQAEVTSDPRVAFTKPQLGVERSLQKTPGEERSGRIGLTLFANVARAERSQVVVSVNSRAVTVVPAEFDGIVTDSANLL